MQIEPRLEPGASTGSSIADSPSTGAKAVSLTSAGSSTQSGPAPRKAQKTRLVRDQDPEENKYHKTLLHQLFDSTLNEQLAPGSAGRVDPKRVFSLVLFLVAIGTLLLIYGST
eukprot:TRINITY_DN14708_c0_g1_i1.p1 TRINITY_DN14708_c0_g1~~TRINITY_DN14708_c0_g1_i1.p1  ORF type:complete len:113 (-),score=7.44 TRINITY_DN14708_c0_g1_i1:238-576(-)